MQISGSISQKKLTILLTATVEPLCKDTPEMRTPRLIRTLKLPPRVSGIEGLHCIFNVLCIIFKYPCCVKPYKIKVP